VALVAVIGVGAPGANASNADALPSCYFYDPLLACLYQYVFQSVVDPAVCAELVPLSGDYGAVRITPDGDLYVRDPIGVIGWAPIYDCPPYDDY